MDLDDPIEWSVDRVVQEICRTQSPSWAAGSTLKLINRPELVAAAFEENDVDGDVLLTLNDEMLKMDLQISSLGLRRALISIIMHLRRISPKYQENHSISANPFATPNLSHVSVTSHDQTSVSNWLGIQPSVEGDKVDEQANTRENTEHSTPIQCHANPLKRLRDEFEAGQQHTPIRPPTENNEHQARHGAATDIQSLPQSDQPISSADFVSAGQDQSLLNTLDILIDQALDTDSRIEGVTAQNDGNISSIPQVVYKKPVKRAILKPVTKGTTSTDTSHNSLFAHADTYMTGVDSNINENSNTQDAGIPTAKRQKITDQSAPTEHRSLRAKLRRRRLRPDQLTAPKFDSQNASSPHTLNNIDDLEFQFVGASISKGQTKRALKNIKSNSNFNFQAAQQPAATIADVVDSNRLEANQSHDLPPNLQSLLERYPANNEPPLPCYGESDEEDRFTTASQSTPDPEGHQIQNSLANSDIDAIIDGCLKQYKEEWDTRYLARVQVKAHKKWMSAAKNQILYRKILASCKSEQNALRKRIRSQRDGIHLSQWYKADDIKQQCLGLEMSIHQLLEYDLYVNVLECETEPFLPPNLMPKQPRWKKRHVTLPNGDEELNSDSADSFVVDDNNEEDSGGLTTLEAVKAWNPRFIDQGHVSTQKPQQPGAILQPYDQDVVFDSIETPHISSDTTTMHTNQHQAGRSDDYTMNVDNQHRPVAGTKAPKLARNQVDFNTGTPTVSRNLFAADSSDADSDFERDARVPNTQYRKLGKSKDKAIDLTSSSPPSISFRGASGLSDLSIRTPKLSPTVLTFGSKMNTTSGKRRSGSSVVQARAERVDKQKMSLLMQPEQVAKVDWDDIEPEDEFGPPDSRLALAKSVYDLGVGHTHRIQDYVNSLRNDADMMDVLQSGIYALKDFESDIEDVDCKNQENARKLTDLFLSYALGCQIDSEFDISEAQCDDAYEVLQSGFKEFSTLIRSLLQRHIETSQSRSVSHDVNLDDYSADEETDLGISNSSSMLKVRKRKVIQNESVFTQQRLDQNRAIAQEEKRALLLKQQSALGVDLQLVSINVEEPIVYLHPKIAGRVKPHQIEGIRFMWREIIENPRHEGCLLAHTMGLGKTFQVIALLSTIVSCNSSMDPRMRNHIPYHLRRPVPRILIICPSALVDNWFDELHNWLPDLSILGTLITMDKFVRNPGTTIQWWYDNGGVLMISYNRFRKYVLQRGNPERVNPGIQMHLTKGPDIVIADEAHMMKNAASLTNQAAQMIDTKSRIAMTGSPLNNYLEEYHTMLNWISPGYLGNMIQFKARYIEPISRGLYNESTSWERKASMKRLHMLKRIIAPKIHRADITAISKDMPPKTEFILTLTLTDTQKEAYQLYVEHLRSNSNAGTGKTTNTRVWSWLNILSLLLSHPSCFIEKLQHEQELKIAFAAREQRAESNDEAVEEIDGTIAALSAENIDVGNQPELASAMDKVMNVFAKVPHRMSDPSLSNKALLIRHIVEEAVGLKEKTIVFSKSIPSLNYYERMIQNTGHVTMRIDGQNLNKNAGRQEQVKAFNTDDTFNVCFISTKAGGLGLNIQSATRVIIADFDFNPAWEEQAIGRAYRLGQKKPVFVYRFLIGGTFEELVHNKAVYKTQLFTRVVDEKNVIAQAGKKPGEFLFDPREVEKKNFEHCLGRDPEILDRVLEKIDCVRDILLTETFFQEDKDELNEQEVKEADALLELERLEQEDPKEYERRTKVLRMEAGKAQTEQLAARRAENIRAPGSMVNTIGLPPYIHHFAPSIPVQQDPNYSRLVSTLTSPLHGQVPHQVLRGTGFGDEFVNTSSQLGVEFPPFRDDQAMHYRSSYSQRTNPAMSFFKGSTQAMRAYFNHPNSRIEYELPPAKELTYKGLTSKEIVARTRGRGLLSAENFPLASGLAFAIAAESSGTDPQFTAEVQHADGATREEADIERATTASGCRPQ